MSAPPSPTQLSGDSAQAQVDAFKQLTPLLPQYAQTLTDIQKTQAPQLSQLNLDQQQLFGPQLIQASLDNLKLADPTGFQVRKTLGESVLNDLQQGRNLNSQQTHQAEQDVRAGQVARGGGTGIGDSIQEAVQKYQLGENQYQNRLANAGAFLSGAPPQSSFGALNQAGKTAPVGTQDVSGFSGNLFPSTNQLIGAQANNFSTMSNNTNAANALANNQYQYRDQNTSNPFLTGLGAFGSFASNIVGGSGGIRGLASIP